MSNEQSNQDFNVIQTFIEEYYPEDSTLTEHEKAFEVKTKMETFLKEKFPKNKIKNKKILEGKREMDTFTIDVLAQSHNICIGTTNHPDEYVHEIYNTKHLQINLDFGKYYKKETKKRKLANETEGLPPKKKTKKTGIASTKSELFIENISYIYKKAQQEIETLEFKIMKKYFDSNHVIGSFRIAEDAEGADKFKFYKELKKKYLPTLDKCWNVCEYEMEKVLNSNIPLNVREYINKNVIVVDSMLFSNLDDLFKKHLETGLKKEKGIGQIMFSNIEKISLECIKRKLIHILSTYIMGFLKFL
jgi:hypothetical protein